MAKGQVMELFAANFGFSKPTSLDICPSEQNSFNTLCISGNFKV